MKLEIIIKSVYHLYNNIYNYDNDNIFILFSHQLKPEKY